MLSNDDIAALLEAGHETRGIERKRGVSRKDKAFVAKVARAAMALSNQRDGGHILIGVENGDRTGQASGLEADVLAEWMDLDTVSAQLNRYADPPLVLAAAPRELPNGKPIVVLEVTEFSEIPTICKKDSDEALQEGALYTRSMAKVESSAKITQNELREVIALATEKQLARFVRTARGAGVEVTSGPSDADLFAEQVTEWETAATRILTVPHMRLDVQPVAFLPRRVEYDQLVDTINQATVRYRGWPLPFVDSPGHDDEWFGEVLDLGTSQESWRLYQSGLFTYARALRLDTPADSTSGQVPGQHYFPVWQAVTFLTEAIEFAGRLQRLVGADEAVVVTVSIQHIDGWVLVVDDTGRMGFFGQYRFGTGGWTRMRQLSPEESLASRRDVAVALAKDVLQRFGWINATEQVVREVQTRIFREPAS